MAIGRVSGPMLQANLERQGSNLAFETNLLYLDVTNSRIGVGTASPGFSLEVAGDAEIGNVEIDTNTITTTNTNGNLILNANGTGTIDVSSKKITSVATPTAGTDAANKTYVDSVVGTTDGMDLDLGTPTDSSLTVDGAYLNWLTTTKVTDAIDDLNEVTENIRNDTFVKSTSFVANVTSGGAGLVVTLTITTVGNPNRYDITWGDGNSTNNTSDSTPTHTYATNVGSPFTVTVRAYNNGGAGSGSEASSTRTSYIIIYTANPVVSFAAYAASTGGSPITYWDDGATVYFDNNTTNIGGATIQYTWDWGDSESDNVISSDSAAGGSVGARLAHTFTASTEQERTRTVELTLDAHNTADPSQIPTDSSTAHKIYDTHTPTVGLSATTGINQEGTSGLPITFTNNTEATIGNFATYGQQYVYTWGDGTANTTVNVGVGGSGDTGNTLAHTFALSGANQAAGNDVDYTGNLRVTSSHSSSPFISANFTVHVEPDVRCNIAATAVTISDRSGDNQYDLYDLTDYNGNNRALVRATNTSQNADSYVYTWNDGDTNNVTEDGSAAGSIGATLDHSYAGESAGNYIVSVLASGTPDLTAQTDTDADQTFTINATPAAPGNLSAESLTLSDSYQGSSPKLCSGFADNSTSNPLSAGASLTTTTARRYTSGTIDTNNVTNAYNGGAGTLTAKVNGVDRGNKTFSSTLNENGTFTSLVVSDQRDANDTISSSTYPTGFYQTFDAKITQALGSYTVGVNDERLEHSATGNTNYVSVVYDDITASPTVANVGTLSEGTAGTKRYISGVPYYNTGSPTLNLAGVQISNLTGQAYKDTSSVVEVDSGTNQESTSSNAFSNQNYTYANIDGASTMLSSGIPVADTGVASAYTLGTLSIPITTSSVRTVDRAKVRCSNTNGTTSYSNIGTTNIQVHRSSQSGIVEQTIVVADALGNGTHTDDGKRVFNFSAATTDNPAVVSATNYYTSSLYSESADPGVSGTKEATIRLGVMKYDVTNYSSGYLPVGPDRSGDTGAQYYTFAFRRQVVSNFDLNITSAGIAGLWIAAPGTDIDDASGLNGWIDASTTYGGSGVPGSDTGNGGNGSDGCAFTSGDRIAASTALSGGYTMTLGSENMSNATANVVLVRIKLTTGQSVTAISVGEAS
jgi:hypothetical protein